MHQLTYTKRAAKALLSMPLDTARMMREKLRQLAEAPYAPNNNATKLGYRLRVGDWRVIYGILDDQLVILVLDFGPCGGIYS